MLTRLFRRCAHRSRSLARTLRQRLISATKPAEQGVAVGALTDLVRGRPALIAEKAFRRQQLLSLRRPARRPRCTAAERALLVLLASRLRTWRHALLLVQPDTLLRWHRHLFRWSWRRRSRDTAPAHRPPRAPETVALLREMATANRLWGAERIRGERLQLDLRVAKSTIQRYLRHARPPRRSGQPWATFLRHHAHETGPATSCR
jgi:putative transposase